MRIAVLSDIHGNSIALNAVLADIEARGGVDTTWLLGDLVAIGPDPVATLRRLRAIPAATTIRGNTDRYLVTGAGPWPREDDVAADPSLRARYNEIQAGFAWTRDQLRRDGSLGWLATLPLDYRLDLPDGTRTLLVHASPGTDDGYGINPAQTEAEHRELIQDAHADLILVGQTHWSGRLDIDGIDVVATGSVSNPHPPDLRASYALIDANPDGYEVQHRRVAYDLDAAIAATEASGHPAAAWINSHFRGERTPGWAP